ncbi:UBP1-associated protein 2C-like [Argentina anserina]|uniref:UBP1-associated protein 2C-like n=1 Tax=Argentina anserina TaxID=57926 RepID=UPI0021766CA4|nr:UBP1-associated protein 2C-like [Potentilla anserina]XP_050367837.1 UBP1-associated protein 2C-like [Potentilla anserina]XP_050367838.1 UBP1-associated protein 2C-like [Potentilla anserina]
MDCSLKKRKTEENGDVSTAPPPSSEFTTLTPDDFRKLLQPMSHDHLVEILQTAVVRHPDVLESLRHVTNRDATLRKLFVRGLGADTTTDSLRAVFSAFGDLDEAIVIFDKATGKSKGYGFVTFKHADEALIALREPSKKIDGRVTVTQYAAAGHSASFSSSNGGADVSARKIYVGTVPFDISSERLLSAFSAFGEIEEGPLGFDKVTGKSKGFAFFVYKTEEGARAALVEPLKNIDGHQVTCKLAVDNKKGKHGGGGQGPAGDNSGVPPPQQMQPGMFRPQLQPGLYAGYPGGYEPRYNSPYGVPPQMPPSSHGAYSDGPRYGVSPPQHYQAPPMPRGTPGGMYQGPY